MVATLFQSLGYGQPDFPAEAKDAAALYMLSLFSDVKEMSPYWQTCNLERMLKSMIQLLPSIKILMTQVCCVLSAVISRYDCLEPLVLDAMTT